MFHSLAPFQRRSFACSFQAVPVTPIAIDVSIRRHSWTRWELRRTFVMRARSIITRLRTVINGFGYIAFLILRESTRLSRRHTVPANPLFSTLTIWYSTRVPSHICAPRNGCPSMRLSRFIREREDTQKQCRGATLFQFQPTIYAVP